MKKIILSLSALVVFGLAACDNQEKKTDTNGAVPAKVVDNVTETDIVVMEDTIPTVAESLEDAQAQNQADTQIEEKAKEPVKEAPAPVADENEED